MSFRTEGCKICYPQKRNFTHASTLTYTTETTHMEIKTAKKIKVHFLPTLITRQKKTTKKFRT